MMNTTAQVSSSRTVPSRQGDAGRLLLGTGLAMASLILMPALAQRMGVGGSLTSAMRVVLMKAANRV